MRRTSEGCVRHGFLHDLTNQQELSLKRALCTYGELPRHWTARDGKGASQFAPFPFSRSSRSLASTRSGISKPSVNQP
jgi:hypothetical protein